ncbi:multiple epidermal growth factor-like domains protein 6 [Saccostrea echinata]|uniref:multiple epidermal growth factor-like domains protein 6 n=1 Tax=Saccostrea echinata TaxID=191078 RepID=UPI002A7F1438|nr:multiple epidermal growth factor-like domains protein 6 [Saccostrea echinata]
MVVIVEKMEITGSNIMILLAILIYLSAAHTTAYDNLALGKPAYQDDEWPYEVRDLWGAQNAVDGYYRDRSAFGYQCTISKNHKWRATWRVDLLSIVSISHINIYFRTDNRPSPGLRIDRFGGFFLYVSNTTSKDDGHLCFHYVESGYESRSEDKRINCSVQGRYVIYYNERRPGVKYPSYYSKYAHTDLCEVQVWGCPNDLYYGENCTKPCPSNCQGRRCDIITGECLGCAPGYRGPRCSQMCEDQRYGPGCSMSCGHCRNGETCHHVNGTCLNGCKEGMAGEKCEEACPTGSYGLHCLTSCKEYCGGEGTCNPVTGICHSGCKEGWTGPLCRQGEPNNSSLLSLTRF